MSDYTELKRLAEAATQCSGPLRVETDYNGVHQVLGDGSWKILNAWHTPDGKGRFNAEFHAAASPLVVLALISAIDVLRNDTESRCEWINEASAEIDRLQAIEAERDQLKAENEIFEGGMRSLASTLGAGGYNAATLTATQLVDKVQWGVDHLAETSGRQIDALRAEVAGLRTGYEAYERVNAELKAENEALRKLLLEASEEIDTWGAYASAYFQEKHDLAGRVEKFHAAAMGKGEQS